MTRQETLRAVVREFNPEANPDTLEGVSDRAAHRFLLVERNLRGYEPPFYFSTHSSLEDAGRYHVDQEYATDWAVECAVNLENELRYEFGGYTPIWIAPMTLVKA